jgi:hypothetical protein
LVNIILCWNTLATKPEDSRLKILRSSDFFNAFHFLRWWKRRGHPMQVASTKIVRYPIWIKL